eukprot:Nk52_evm35s1569 gene=Nk52_evmTU35s1569
MDQDGEQPTVHDPTVDHENFQQWYSVGTSVWVQDEGENRDGSGWVLGKVVDVTSEQINVKIHGQKFMHFKKDQIKPFIANPDRMKDVGDMATLPYIHEPGILDCLSVRFDQQHIYTSCGIVLVALNPNKDIPDLYTANVSRMYHQQAQMQNTELEGSSNRSTLPPHIFQIAEHSYQAIRATQKNQSIIISGESGAGKTVSAKLILQYLAHISDVKEHSKNELENKIMASNPLLESFGNAKTARNDNSSRFGKYLMLEFSSASKVIGAKLNTYLLEKSRVSHFSQDERGFHIFYQLCSGISKSERALFKLKSASEFKYLDQGKLHIEDVDDNDLFSEVLYSIDTIGLSGFRNDIFKTLSAILHIGNVDIEPHHSSKLTKKDMSQIKDECESLEIAALFLGVEKEKLAKWICNTQIKTGTESITTHLSVHDTIDTRDALAKSLYSKLFGWLVKSVNSHLDDFKDQRAFIGILDIYGFETFSENGFEQFCINYANEKLQHMFTKHACELEQEEYIREGLKWHSIHFNNNKECLNLIEGNLSIFSILNEECKIKNKNDDTFLEKMKQYLNKNACFGTKSISNRSFFVKHYGGVVNYDVSGFVEKNRNKLEINLEAVLHASKNPFIANLYNEDPRISTPKGKKSSSSTLSSDFKSSLSHLVELLYSNSTHYIRCLKANDRKAPLTLERETVLEQIRSASLVETLRVNSAGFSTKIQYAEFARRYKTLIDVKITDPKEATKECLSKHLSSSAFILGKTKAFLKSGQQGILETAMYNQLMPHILKLQSRCVGYAQRNKYLKLRKGIVALQALVKGSQARKKAAQMKEENAAITIQKHIKGRKERRKFSKKRDILQKHKAAFKIQRSYSAFIRIKENRIQETSAILIQSWYRIHLAKKRMKQLRMERNAQFSKLKKRNTQLELELNKLKKDQEHSMLHTLSRRESSEKLMASNGLVDSATENSISALIRENAELTVALQEERDNNIELNVLLAQTEVDISERFKAYLCSMEEQVKELEKKVLMYEKLLNENNVEFPFTKREQSAVNAQESPLNSRRQVENLGAQLKRSQSSLGEAELELRRAKRKVESLQREKKNFSARSQAELQTAKNEVESMEEEILKLTIELERTKEENSQLFKAAVGKAQLQNTSEVPNIVENLNFNREMLALKTKLEMETDLKKEKENIIDILKAQIFELKQANEELQSKERQVETSFASSSHELHESQLEIEKLRRKNLELQEVKRKALHSKTMQISNLKNEQSKLERTQRTLESNVVELEIQLKSSKAQVSVLESRVKDLESANTFLTSTQTTYAHNQSKESLAEATNSAFVPSYVEKAAKRAPGLEVENSNLQVENNRLHRHLEINEMELKDLQVQYQTLKHSSAQEHESLRAQIETLKLEKKRQRESVGEKMRALNHDIKQLRKDKDIQEEKISRDQAIVADLQNKVERQRQLNVELADSNRSVSSSLRNLLDSRAKDEEKNKLLQSQFAATDAQLKEKVNRVIELENTLSKNTKVNQGLYVANKKDVGYLRNEESLNHFISGSDYGDAVLSSRQQRIEILLSRNKQLENMLNALLSKSNEEQTLLQDNSVSKTDYEIVCGMLEQSQWDMYAAQNQMAYELVTFSNDQQSISNVAKEIDTYEMEKTIRIQQSTIDSLEVHVGNLKESLRKRKEQSKVNKKLLQASISKVQPRVAVIDEANEIACNSYIHDLESERSHLQRALESLEQNYECLFNEYCNFKSETSDTLNSNAIKMSGLTCELKAKQSELANAKHALVLAQMKLEDSEKNTMEHCLWLDNERVREVEERKRLAFDKQEILMDSIDCLMEEVKHLRLSEDSMSDELNSLLDLKLLMTEEKKDTEKVFKENERRLTSVIEERTKKIKYMNDELYKVHSELALSQQSTIDHCKWLTREIDTHDHTHEQLLLKSEKLHSDKQEILMDSIDCLMEEVKHLRLTEDSMCDELDSLFDLKLLMTEKKKETVEAFKDNERQLTSVIEERAKKIKDKNDELYKVHSELALSQQSTIDHCKWLTKEMDTHDHTHEQLLLKSEKLRSDKQEILMDSIDCLMEEVKFLRLTEDSMTDEINSLLDLKLLITEEKRETVEAFKENERQMTSVIEEKTKKIKDMNDELYKVHSELALSQQSTIEHCKWLTKEIDNHDRAHEILLERVKEGSEVKEAIYIEEIDNLHQERLFLERHQESLEHENERVLDMVLNQKDRAKEISIEYAEENDKLKSKLAESEKHGHELWQEAANAKHHLWARDYDDSEIAQKLKVSQTREQKNQKEISRLKGIIAQTKRNNNTAQDKVENEKALSSLKRAEASHKNEIASLKRELDTLRKDCKYYKEVHDDIVKNKNVHHLRKEVDHLKGTIKQQSKHIHGLENKHSNRPNRIESAGVLSAKLSLSQQKNEILIQEIDELHKEREYLSYNLKKCEDELDFFIESKSNAAHGYVQSIEDMCHLQNQRISEMNQKLNDIKEEKGQVRKELGKANETNGMLEQQLVSVSEWLSKEIQQTEELGNQRIESKEHKMGLLYEELCEQNIERKHLERQIGRLEDESSAHFMEKLTLKDNMEDVLDEKKNLLRQIDDLGKSLKKSSREHAKTKRQLYEAETAVEGLEDEKVAIASTMENPVIATFDAAESTNSKKATITLIDGEESSVSDDIDTLKSCNISMMKSFGVLCKQSTLVKQMLKTFRNELLMFYSTLGTSISGVEEPANAYVLNGLTLMVDFIDAQLQQIDASARTDPESGNLVKALLDSMIKSLSKLSHLNANTKSPVFRSRMLVSKDMQLLLGWVSDLQDQLSFEKERNQMLMDIAKDLDDERHILHIEQISALEQNEYMYSRITSPKSTTSPSKQRNNGKELPASSTSASDTQTTRRSTYSAGTKPSPAEYSEHAGNVYTKEQHEAAIKENDEFWRENVETLNAELNQRDIQLMKAFQKIQSLQGKPNSGKATKVEDTNTFSPKTKRTTSALLKSLEFELQKANEAIGQIKKQKANGSAPAKSPPPRSHAEAAPPKGKKNKNGKQQNKAKNPNAVGLNSPLRDSLSNLVV